MSIGDIKFDKPLPQYQCIKIVGALKIKHIEHVRMGRFEVAVKLHFQEDGFDPIVITERWADQHKVVGGGYLVQYSNDYVSFSPEQSFKEGYFLIDPDASLIDFPQIPKLKQAAEWLRRTIDRYKGPNI